jgi:competence protein ComEC
MNPLSIYVLNVGQGDTALIVTPGGKVIVFDAYRPQKVADALAVAAPAAEEIDHLILTHPHNDHYSAAARLLADYRVRKVTLAPFWYDVGRLGAGYYAIINRIQELNASAGEERTALRFLSGYERSYPDGGAFDALEGGVCLELLGPPNDILRELERVDGLTPNHLSIMARLTYGNREAGGGRQIFSLVLAGDAQMENWVHYDREGMLDEPCDVLKAAHHGSKNGTQWERLARLAPRLVIVSSETAGPHGLPDLIGAATFWEYGQQGAQVALTGVTGTIQLLVHEPASGRYDRLAYGEGPTDLLSSHAATPLGATDWEEIVVSRLHG